MQPRYLLSRNFLICAFAFAGEIGETSSRPHHRSNQRIFPDNIPILASFVRHLPPLVFVGGSTTCEYASGNDMSLNVGL